MYNRYIRDDKGSYTRVSQEEHRKPEAPHREDPPKHAPPKEDAAPRHRSEQVRHDADAPQPSHAEMPRKPTGSAAADGLTGILRHFLDRFHMDHVDTGDLLLLGLLFFLFREDTDEELLTALGLLLIL